MVFPIDFSILIKMPIVGENLMNVPLLRNQLRGFDLLAAIRLYRHGFPEYLTFREFRRLFEPLVNARESGSGGGPRSQQQDSKKERDSRGGASKGNKAKIPYLGDDKLVSYVSIHCCNDLLSFLLSIRVQCVYMFSHFTYPHYYITNHMPFRKWINF